jgi:hypothetical protein
MDIHIHVFKWGPGIIVLGQNFDQLVRDTVTPLISRVDNELLPTLDVSSNVGADEVT